MQRRFELLCEEHDEAPRDVYGGMVQSERSVKALAGRVVVVVVVAGLCSQQSSCASPPFDFTPSPGNTTSKGLQSTYQRH